MTEELELSDLRNDLRSMKLKCCPKKFTFANEQVFGVLRQANAMHYDVL